MAVLGLQPQPGTEWNYSVATDVLGRVVELASGRSLDQFFAERIFEPLGMIDTGFAVPAVSVNRLAALYTPAPVVGGTSSGKTTLAGSLIHPGA